VIATGLSSNLASVSINIIPFLTMIGAPKNVGQPQVNSAPTVRFSNMVIAKNVSEVGICLSQDLNLNKILDPLEECNVQNWVNITSSIGASGTRIGSGWLDYTLVSGLDGASFTLNMACDSTKYYFTSIRSKESSGHSTSAHTLPWTLWNPSCLGANLKLWLDASDDASLTLQYNSVLMNGSGSVGSPTISTAAGIDANLVIGSQIILGSDALNVYSVTALTSVSITVKPNLVATVSNAVIYRADASAWLDKSGSGYNVGQGAAASMPWRTVSAFSDRKAIYFDGTSSYLTSVPTITAGTGCTIAAVVKDAGTVANNMAIVGQQYGGSGPISFYLGYTNSSNLARMGFGEYYGPWRTADTGQAIPAASPVMYIGTSALNGVTNPANVLYRDGAQAATYAGTLGSNNFTAGFRIGAGWDGSRFKGYMTEIVYVSGTISTVDRQQLEGYLAWKWGTTGNLQAVHPYKAIAP
jgi:hypothetical protein